MWWNLYWWSWRQRCTGWAGVSDSYAPDVCCLASIDSNQDGKISFEEMKQVRLIRKQWWVWYILITIFYWNFPLFGQVTSEECRKRGSVLAEKWFEEIFKDLDNNGDGEIDYAEFVSAVTRIYETWCLYWEIVFKDLKYLKFGFKSCFTFTLSMFLSASRSSRPTISTWKTILYFSFVAAEIRVIWY